MLKKVKFRSVISILLILTILLFNFIILTEPSYGFSLFNIQKQRKETIEKIKELRRKENIEVNKLYKHQQKLEATNNDIMHLQNKLNHAENKLDYLEDQYVGLKSQKEQVADEAGERLKQIYKGERISILHLIFASSDINTLLDRIYYQKRLASQDKILLADLRVKAARVASSKRAIEGQKSDISSTINVMDVKRKQISSSISTTKVVINKLRTDRATYEAAEKELARASARLETRLKKSESSNKIQTVTGFGKPIIGTITSPFGWRKHPIFGSRSFHSGVDIAAPNKTPVKASNSGKVIFTGWYGGYGKVVIVSHGKYNGTQTSTLYAHLSGTAVGVGGTVRKGQVVGYEGTTGYSTGPHLHFEVRLNGKPTNPLKYI